MPPVSTAASLAVPLSQNTAEVREHRCMFTHDLRRKAKRWNDGTLTFHVFNNRIVVFDEAKNRVGDAYWDKRFDFGDGEELQLQQGVLVEVQEQLSRKEQDVTGVIVNRDINKTSQAASTRPSPWKAVTTIGPSGSGPQQHRVATTGLQGQRPKSLKELLKTPQGSMLGRARMPDSPYEQRHGGSPSIAPGREPVVLCGKPMAGISAAPEESPRPRKRPRLSDHEPVSKRTAPATSAAVTGKARSKASKTISVPPMNHATNPIVIDSDDDTSDPTFERQTPISRTARREEPPRRSKSNTGPVPAQQSSSTTSITKPRPQASDRPAISNAAPSTEISAGSRQIESNVLRERPVNILKQASGQPRRKLMYRDLLPSSFAFKNTKSQNSSTDQGRGSSITGKGPAKQAQRSTPRPSCSRPTTAREVSPADGDNGALETASNLPVIAPTTPRVSNGRADAPPESSLPNPDSFFMTDDALTLAELDQALVASKKQQALRSAASREQASGRAADPAEDRAKIRETTAAVAGLQASAQSPRRGPLQRVLTEPAPKSPDPLPRRRSPLKKTVSDTTGRKERPPEPAVVDREADRGPWSREAFDLFGWNSGDSKEVITRVALR